MSKETEVFKVREIPSGISGARKEKIFNAPRNAEGYYRRDVSRDGMTITYRKVA